MTPRLSTLTCPSCGATSEETMPTDACVFFWTCPECDTRHRPKDGDCCVFCSYGSEPCPPVQDAADRGDAAPGCLDCADPAERTPSSAEPADGTPSRDDPARCGPSCADPAVLEALQVIPGVGERVSRDLWELGVREVDDLRGRDPQELYDRLCEIQGTRMDLCMLYTLRCAVYFASTEEPDPELLKWWAWKGRTVAGEGAG